MPERDSDSRVGTEIGGYRLDAVIGKGGMGTVYLATRGDQAPVALKLINADLHRNDTFTRRFQREATGSMAIRNPHVVPVLEVGEHEGAPYLVAELIDGGSLRARLDGDGRLGVTDSVKLCVEVSAGLQAVWDAGMVHRDVKPENILLSRAGDAYLTDFGLVKQTRNPTATVLTMPGQMMGSMDYISPEQLRGDPVTGAADIYSLGCVVYECLNGSPPFGHLPGTRVLFAHLREEPADLSLAHPEISPALAHAVSLALRKDPAQRPGAAAYADAVARAISS